MMMFLPKKTVELSFSLRMKNPESSALGRNPIFHVRERASRPTEVHVGDGP
jgi:hypothetical protein